MTTLSLRLPDSLHRQLRELARREGISMNQFISSAVGEKMAALMTEEYLGARAARGDGERFDEILAKVPDEKPVAGDEVGGQGGRP